MAKCEHGQRTVTMTGCAACVSEAMAGLRILRACRQELGMSTEDVVNTLREAKGLPPLADTPTPEGSE